MDDNLTLIKAEFEKMKGQFVITQTWNIERLIALGEDEHDYYYITYDGRSLRWNTCVGRVMPLKGRLDAADYGELVRIARLNHYDQQTLWSNDKPEVFAEAAKHHVEDLLRLAEGHKFLTEVCMDLN